MRSKIDSQKYVSTNIKYLPVSEQCYLYPINSFLSETVKRDDELKVILIVQKDNKDCWQENLECFKKELNEIAEKNGANVDYTPLIESNFNQEKATHEQLIMDLVDRIETNSHIMVDITYGSKSLPIILFTVLNFATSHLSCEVDNIVYGQASSDKDNKLIKDSTKLFDMIPLYYLSFLPQAIQYNGNNPAKVKDILRSLILF